MEMKCSKVRRVITDSIYGSGGRLPGSVELHLKQCDTCRGFLSAVNDVGTLTNTERVSVNHGLIDRSFSSAEKICFKRRIWIELSLFIITALLFLVFILYFLGRGGPAVFVRLQVLFIITSPVLFLFLTGMRLRRHKPDG